jgi:hypothetical protein
MDGWRGVAASKAVERLPLGIGKETAERRQKAGRRRQKMGERGKGGAEKQRRRKGKQRRHSRPRH